MTLTSRSVLILFVCALGLFSPKNVLACQCFNSYFINSIFYNSQNVTCYISRDHGRIISARISDGTNSATSLFYGCSLNSVYSNVSREFYDLFTNDNDLCIDEILHACMMLNVEPYSE
ncbi:hypothetical protein [uncultured Legionella sp.]|uniref:hypothetical protein n=1 Tax=uncultured Legionella sp. TaxID=210934 RepID=UPI0026311A95|nr:hypothetical protein [uncultured Legionella sp.]